ncbi:MAG: hypothetical protein PUF37_01035 [Prevotellaceae bacterium]|nr:hypothetical protein [Prevotellaceae bacterium]
MSEATNPKYGYLPQIDACIQQYYNKYLRPAIIKEVDEVNKKKSQEYLKYKKQTSSVISGLGAEIASPGSQVDIQDYNAMSKAMDEGTWNKKTTESIVKNVHQRWSKSKQTGADLRMLKNELHKELIRQCGGKDSKEIRELTEKYWKHRMYTLSVNALASRKAPHNYIDYMVRELLGTGTDVNTTIVGGLLSAKNNNFITSKGMVKVTSEYDDDVNKSSVYDYYKPNAAEKISATAASAVIDYYTLRSLGGLGKVGKFIGGKYGKASAAVDLGARGFVYCKFDKPEWENKKYNKDNSKLYFGNENAIKEITLRSNYWNHHGTEFISHINDKLSKNHKIKVHQYNFHETVRANSNYLLRNMRGNSVRLMKSIQKDLSQRALDVKNTKVPAWMFAKTAKQCRAFAASFHAIAVEMSRSRQEIWGPKNAKLRLIQVAQRSYDYARAAVMIDEANAKARLEQAEKQRAARERVAERRANRESRAENQRHSPTQQSQGQSSTNTQQPQSSGTPSSSNGQATDQTDNMSNQQQLGGWNNALDAMGLGDFGTTGKNLGYVLATLPDMLIAMMTGKTSQFKLENNMLPLAAILMGMFTKNKFMKLMLMGLGGAGLLNSAGHEALSDKDREALKKKNFKTYSDEPLNPRIKNPEIKGRSLVANIDGRPLVITINSDEPLYCYEKGILPLNVLANSILQKYDEMQNAASISYEQRIQAEQSRNIGIK